MHLSSRFQKKLLALIVGALLVSALAATPAPAKGTRPRPTGYEQCWVTPNPLYQSPWIYTVWGSSFPPGMAVTVFVSDASATWVLSGTVGANGTFGTSDNARFNYPGMKNVTVYQEGDRRMTPWCSTSFAVNF